MITDRKPGQLGTVGIHLFGWSPHPPARRGAVRQTVIAPYARDEVEQTIKAGLIGEPVKADILIEMPRPGASTDPENVVMEVVKIEPGPTEASRLGVPMFDDE